MRSGQVWSGVNQVPGQEKQAGQPPKGQPAPGEDETEKVGEKNGPPPPGRSAADTAGPRRPEGTAPPDSPASLRSAEEEVEVERPPISPAAARSLKETALLEFLASPVSPNLQADERESGVGEMENASVLDWRSGAVLSLLTLGMLASHHRHQSTKRDAKGRKKERAIGN